jgi:hypothetical protein
LQVSEGAAAYLNPAEGEVVQDTIDQVDIVTVEDTQRKVAAGKEGCSCKLKKPVKDVPRRTFSTLSHGYKRSGGHIYWPGTSPFSHSPLCCPTRANQSLILGGETEPE